MFSKMGGGTIALGMVVTTGVCEVRYYLVV